MTPADPPWWPTDEQLAAFEDALKTETYPRKSVSWNSPADGHTTVAHVAVFSALEREERRRGLRTYLDFHDWWIGYYRGDDHHYVCLLPTWVIRWNRR